MASKTHSSLDVAAYLPWSTRPSSAILPLLSIRITLFREVRANISKGKTPWRSAMGMQRSRLTQSPPPRADPETTWSNNRPCQPTILFCAKSAGIKKNYRSNFHLHYVKDDVGCFRSGRIATVRARHRLGGRRGQHPLEPGPIGEVAELADHHHPESVFPAACHRNLGRRESGRHPQRNRRPAD